MISHLQERSEKEDYWSLFEVQNNAVMGQKMSALNSDQIN
jgi:hypothetical protein